MKTFSPRRHSSGDATHRRFLIQGTLLAITAMATRSPAAQPTAVGSTTISTHSNLKKP